MKQLGKSAWEESQSQSITAASMFYIGRDTYHILITFITPLSFCLYPYPPIYCYFSHPYPNNPYLSINFHS